VLLAGAVFHVLLDLFIHKKRGRFRFYFDRSHVHCLVFEWARARRTGAPMSDRSEPEDDE
jgi:hypothetical protein